MVFDEPVPPRDALEYLARQSLLPTGLDTALLEELPTEVLERSMLSATVTEAEFLQEALDGVREIVAGKSSRTDQRLKLRRLLSRLGYQPAEGEAGSLKDLRTSRRLNLILDTNADLARGYAQFTQGQDEDVLDEFPAQELVRWRRSAVERPWAQIWQVNGGRIFNGRMIALKSDDIWVAISRFNLPYPPFDFGSGMGDADVDRDEAEDFGLLGPDDFVEPMARRFNEDLQASPQVRDEVLRKALETNLKGRFTWDANGVLKQKEAA